MTCTFPNCKCVHYGAHICKNPTIQAMFPSKAGFGATQRLYTETDLQAAIAAAMMGPTLRQPFTIKRATVALWERYDEGHKRHCA